MEEPIVSKGRYTERTFEAADSAGLEIAAAEFQEFLLDDLDLRPFTVPIQLHDQNRLNIS